MKTKTVFVAMINLRKRKHKQAPSTCFIFMKILWPLRQVRAHSWIIDVAKGSRTLMYSQADFVISFILCWPANSRSVPCDKSLPVGEHFSVFQKLVIEFVYVKVAVNSKHLCFCL